MTSSQLKYYSQADFRGGISDNQENLNPKNQVLDSRNCWAPLGTLVRRPGYGAIAQYAAESANVTGSASYVTSGILYFGANQPFYYAAYAPNVTNTNAGAQFRYEYWNGSAWMAISGAHQDDGLDVIVPLYCGSAYIVVKFAPPENWTTTVVNSLTRYWIRLVVAGFQAPSATPTSVSSVDLFSIDSTILHTVQGLFQFRYNSGSNYVVSFMRGVNENFIYPRSFLDSTAPSGGYSLLGPPQPPMQGTTIPEFNRGYVTWNNTVVQITHTNVASTAQVNTDPLIVGPIASDPAIPYPADVIPQLPAFPAANLIINFRNLIFASGILGQPTLIRWSGAVNEGAFNVWPETSFETLSTAKDNSPITALAGLGDNLVVFKQDSIWQLIYNGLDDQQLPTFVPQLVVAGVGCVSQGSVQEVRGRLIFLAEDGFYAFDGTPNIKKISEPINTTAQRINPSHKPFASAVNWRSQYCYLCSTALDESSANNIIFVYDYKHDAWWLWDDIPAEFMLTTSDTALQEQVIFGNQTAGFFQLGGETNNFGTISNYVTTGRFGQDDVLWKSAREVRLREQNIDGPTTYTLYADDLQLGVSSKTCTMDSPDETHATPNPANGCDNVPIRRRERKMPQRLLGEWFQVKAEGFKLLEGVNVGYSPESRR